MIRIALHCIALPAAIALVLALSACQPTSDDGVSETGASPADTARASPPSASMPADAPPPMADPAPVTPPSSSEDPPMTNMMMCDDSKGQTAVGQTATQAVVDKVIADTGSRNARVIKPDQSVTMDYREDRVNINVDANNVIISVKCG
ncbi:MAG: I78 family peptidase inhibitor [Pseudomonadota bacterium]|nr:I78 family peptidase inhibitor [Pseudomonadota bacterium]MDQ3229309.1 I78 family peptidase inhibitor [Pseudomonadota bacterium]